MIEALAVGSSLPEAYHRALELLGEQGEISPCPD
jgi:hypothetical protein